MLKTCQLFRKLPLWPRRTALAVLAACSMQVVQAQTIPKVLNTPYPGTISLRVDVTDLAQKIFRVRESLPVRPGKLVLLYPQWLPGNHSPSNPIVQLGGLTFKGNGKAIEWRRDPVEMYAFHLEIPSDVTTLEAEYQFLSPVAKDQGRITSTPEIVGVQWNSVVLYPAGHAMHGITYQVNLKLPSGWQFGSALESTERQGDEVRFKPVNLAQLVDSPLFAGKYFKRFDLDPNGKVPVHLNVVADNAASLEAKPATIEAHRTLVQQAYKLYNSQHYAHYDFLLSLSDHFSGIGLEHHQSSENGVEPDYFTNWEKFQGGRDLLSHEYTHSWNGKFRRPQEQITPNFNSPMKNSLLWVYEGQTEYWGTMLAARSGLMTAERVREMIAAFAAAYDNVAGRRWRAMQDTTNDPVISHRGPLAWNNWQRSEDYYVEGLLIWLDADTKIREMSKEKRSLNDFARLFFGVKDGSAEAHGYTFDDVVQTLNAVEPYDWTTFLRTRLDGHGPGAPLDGLSRAGWKLIYNEEASEFVKANEENRHITDFSYSLGFTLGKENNVIGILWDSPAFKQGMVNNGTLLAVNGLEYKPAALKAALTEAKTGKTPIELLVKQNGRFHTYHLDYHGGLKYPQLERIPNTLDRLQEILQPMK